MARKRMVLEMGMGTDLHGQDYTKAAVRALRDALWHNSLTVANAFGVPRESMEIEVTIGVAQPGQVDTAAVADVLPYGKASVTAVEGGLDIASEDGSKVTVVANAAAVVYLDIPGRKHNGNSQKNNSGNGTGNDLYGEDYTKAAIRAVHDALHHSSITLFKSLGIDSSEMQVMVTIGVQKPEQVDVERVARELPRGNAVVTAVKGGLDVPDEDNGTITVIATAGIDARIPL